MCTTALSEFNAKQKYAIKLATKYHNIYYSPFLFDKYDFQNNMLKNHYQTKDVENYSHALPYFSNFNYEYIFS